MPTSNCSIPGKAGDDFATVRGVDQGSSRSAETDRAAGGPGKFQDQGAADVQIQIEGAVDELELADAACLQPVHRLQEVIEPGLPHRNIEGRQAEFGKRTAARGST